MDSDITRKLFNFSDDVLNDPDFSKYLQELSSLGADQLAREPDRLSDERSTVSEEIENLAFQNYKTFIQAANCTKNIYDDFTHIESRLSTLLDGMPKVSSACTEFLTQAQKINNSRQAYSLTLSRHSQVLEILEIPQVMDTCLRGGYYDEALELSTYFAKLERRLSHSPVIGLIGEELRKQKSQLVQQMLEHLRGALSLPQCLKMVGLLKRLNVFTEAELRIKFLLSRDSWLEAQLLSASKDDAFQHITRIIEVSRVSLFDIVTHYRAVFADDDPLLGMSVVPSQLSPGGGSSGALFGQLGGVSPVHLPAILSGWITYRIQRFLSILEQDLAKIPGSRLDSVLTQCQFFGQSFARVGADFRGLVIPIFERAVWHEFVTTVEHITQKLKISVGSMTAKHPSSVPHAYADLSGQADSFAKTSAELLKYPSMAIYLNGILAFFNEFRACLPISLAERMSSLLAASLTEIANVFLETEKVKAAGDGNAQTSEKKFFRDFAAALVHNLVPSINLCFEKLFPPQAIASALGFGIVEYNNRKHDYARLKASVFASLLNVSPTISDLSAAAAAAPAKGSGEVSGPETRNITEPSASAASAEPPHVVDESIASVEVAAIPAGNLDQQQPEPVAAAPAGLSDSASAPVISASANVAEHRSVRKATFSIGDDDTFECDENDQSAPPISLDD